MSILLNDEEIEEVVSETIQGWTGGSAEDDDVQIPQAIAKAQLKKVGVTKGGSWNCKGRPRVDKHPLGQKKLFEIR